MRRVAASLTLALAFSTSSATPSAFAQTRRGGTVGRGRVPHSESAPRSKSDEQAALERFQQMSPEERTEALAKLPKDRRQKLQKQLERYDQLSPAQREQLNQFNHLPPERQNAFRKAFQKYQKSPPERQQVMRDELTRLRSMAEEDRAARLASPDFKSRYSKGEQQILSDLAVALPAHGDGKSLVIH